MAGATAGLFKLQEQIVRDVWFLKTFKKKHLWQILKRIWAFRVLFSSFKKLSELCEAHRFFLYKVISSASVVWEWCNYEVSSIFPNGAFFWDKFKLLNTAIFSVSVLGGFAAGSFLNVHMQRNAGFCTYLHPIACSAVSSCSQHSALKEPECKIQFLKDNLIKIT